MISWHYEKKKVSKEEIKRAKKLLTKNGEYLSEVHEELIKSAIYLMKVKDAFEMTLTLSRKTMDEKDEDHLDKFMDCATRAMESEGSMILHFYKKLTELNFL